MNTEPDPSASTQPPPPEAVTVDNHPCFNHDACSQFGRVHLPVAPLCNIQCNYCNRDFDCVNESRPGVTSTVLSPGQALSYLDRIMERRGDIAVVGIAGPGDPMANPEETMETFRLVRARYPGMILCLSTNGLGLTAGLVDELARLQVSHVTVTMNATDPELAGKVYSWARHEKRIHRGRAAGELMIRKQLEAIRMIKERDMIVKVNSILIPGINEDHLPEIAATVGDLGADLMNCIPLLPTEGTRFADLPEPDGKSRFRTRLQCAEHMSQMTHCARCRADATGKLDEGMSGELQQLMQDCSRLPLRPQEDRPYVAVATREGMLVNQHLGEASRFVVFGVDPDDPEDFVAVAERPCPEPGGREARWEQLAAELSDCRAILVNAAGSTPKAYLARTGIQVVEMAGMIEGGLAHLFHGEQLPPVLRRSFEGCGTSCGGDGTGCG